MSPATQSRRPALAFAIPGDLALPTGGYGYDRRVLALLPAEGIDARHLRLPGTYPAPDAAALAATRTVLQATPPGTILLVDGLAYGAMPAATIAGLERTIVALVHHPLCLEAGLTEARARELHALETAALAFAAAVVVTSPATARTLVADFDVPADLITVAEPGTDRAPRAHGTGTPLQLVAVGSIVPRKGYGILVDALTGLRDRSWRLTIAGAARDEATLGALTRQIAAAGLSERIELLGAVVDAQLDALYAGADIFVMPSLFEGYGMVIGEAMARGLPIVCTTGGAAADTAPDAAALKVPPGDASAFAAALARALDDAALRSSMSDASWAAGQRLPRWEDTTRLIAGVIRRVST